MRLRNFIRIVCLILVVFNGRLGYSQKQTQIIPGHLLGYDTGYVVSFRDNLVITLVNESKTSLAGMSLVTAKKDYSLDYETNTLNTWGVGVDYKWLTFEFTTKMPWSSPDPDKGKVQNTGFGFGITGKELSFRNFFQFFKGYYLQNTEDWFPASPNQNYYLRPDIETFTYYSSLNYTFNHHKFSNNASLWQLERQQKKAGSFIAGVSYIFNSFHADSSLIPASGIDSFPVSGNSYFSLNSLGLNLGFVGTLPLFGSKKLFLTGALIPGVSYQFGEITADGLNAGQHANLIGFQSEVRAGFGYNGDKWYTGFIGRMYGNLNALNGESPMSINTNYGRLYLGYRFNSPIIKNKYLKRLGF